jgi:hypothetical protein
MAGARNIRDWHVDTGSARDSHHVRNTVVGPRISRGMNVAAAVAEEGVMDAEATGCRVGYRGCFERKCSFARRGNTRVQGNKWIDWPILSDSRRSLQVHLRGCPGSVVEKRS